MVHTRSQMKASGVQLTEVHGSRKRLDPHKILEKQPQPIIGLDVDRKPSLGQGRAGVRRKALPPSYPRSGTSESEPIIISNGTEPITPKPIIVIPRRQEVGSSKIEIKGNSPFQEDIISEVYERPDKSYFQELIELKDLIDTNNIIQ